MSEFAEKIANPSLRSSDKDSGNYIKSEYAALGNPVVPAQFKAAAGSFDQENEEQERDTSSIGKHHFVAGSNGEENPNDQPQNNEFSLPFQGKFQSGLSGSQNIKQFRYQVADSYKAVPIQRFASELTNGEDGQTEQIEDQQGIAQAKLAAGAASLPGSGEGSKRLNEQTTLMSSSPLQSKQNEAVSSAFAESTIPSGPQTMQLQSAPLPESDYFQQIVQGGGDRYNASQGPINSSNGVNDAAMAPQHNWWSDSFNSVVTSGMDMLGYDTRRRSQAEDNDFYRDYAQYMPGYDINGIPSGAWAQDAATNHIGHGAGPGSPWDNIRRDLVGLERSRIMERQADGESGQLSYWDLYNAHVTAYDRSGGGGNGFVDPGSFAMAVYLAPLLNSVGVDAGPITGASIDLFNNPEDSATEGWVKRMGLAGGEIAGGGLLAGAGVSDIMRGNLLTGGAEVLGGAGLAAAGAFGGGYNTVTALQHGMLNEWGTAASGLAADASAGISNATGAVSDFAEDNWTLNPSEVDWGRTLNPFEW